jgi:zinc transport system substrate-binding protein
MHRKIIRLLAAVMAGLFLLSGCGRAPSGETTETGNARFHIVTSFYPVYIAAVNIAGSIPGVEVTNMTKPQTGCLHDYSLKPEDLKTLEKADAFIVNGAGMEAFLNDVIKRHKDLKIIEASRNIALLKDENGVENPHVWVSVTNAITQVGNISEQLSAADPEHAKQYSSNAAAYVKKLEALKQEMHAAINKLGKKDIITFHEAFPYFAKEFDLHIAAVIEREPDSEPTPRELGGIIDTVEKTGIKALFAEPQYSSKAADAIARETGARVYTLDPVVTGEAGKDSHNAYINAMERNKEVLQQALK